MSNPQLKDTQLAYNAELIWQQVDVMPFLKWAGGKRNLVSSFLLHFPRMQWIKRYFEPFLGGGAVFFHLQHPQSFLSDSNEELIEVYQIVRDSVEDLIGELRKHHNEKEYYYRVRAQDPAQLTPTQRAARFIFLNKTCYNGLYRVNSRGEFNVPFGNYRKPLICDAQALRGASLALKSASLRAADFEDAVSGATAGDLIYLDPPYYPLSETASFTSYTVERFDSDQQKRLTRVFRELDQRNCYLMLSNSDTAFVRDLYDGFRVIEVQANRAINSRADGRGKITELLIVNY